VGRRILVPVPFVEMPRVRVACGGLVLYQTVANADKRAVGRRLQRRENRSDNFFTFVTEEMHGRIPDRRVDA
jgi:hypothetical protein